MFAHLPAHVAKTTLGLLAHLHAPIVKVAACQTNAGLRSCFLPNYSLGYMHMGLHAFLYAQVCLPAYMLACLPACLHACLPACLPAYMLACLPACLPLLQPQTSTPPACVPASAAASTHSIPLPTFPLVCCAHALWRALIPCARTVKPATPLLTYCVNAAAARVSGPIPSTTSCRGTCYTGQRSVSRQWG
jgi:hypothetical protein